MKQLIIMCSESIAGQVTQVLDTVIHMEGYVRLRGYGVKCKVPVSGTYEGKSIPWSAEVFIMALPEDTIKIITDELKQYANRCDTAPCLRMIVTPIEEMF